ncbi:MAG: tetratricopeptide repeat protein [Bacteroidia bacterium]|nr:tetratricopeptide repeat protein [Bacteroidia bacterium]
MKRSLLLLAMLAFISGTLAAQSARDFYNLGCDLFEAGADYDALKVLSIAIEMEPDSAHYWLKRAEVHFSRFEEDFASMDLDTCLQIDSTLAPAWYLLGELESSLQDFETSVAAYTIALHYAREDTLKGAAFLGRALSSAYLGVPLDTLMYDYQQALGRYPDSAFVLSSMGRVYADSGKYARGIFLIEQALEHSPESPEALLAMGHSLGKMGDWEQAMVYADSALGYSPMYSEAWILRGRALLELEFVVEALREVRICLKLEPENPMIWRNRGMAWLLLGKPGKACKDFQMARELGYEILYGTADAKIMDEACGTIPSE